MLAIWFVVHKYYNIHINIMTDRVKNQPGPSTIVNNPRLWPASFTKPEKQTRVCIRTYIFKDSTKVQKFLDFLKEKFPNPNVDVKQLDNGNISVTITSSPQISNYNIYTKKNCCVGNTKFNSLLASNLPTSDICCKVIITAFTYSFTWTSCNNGTPNIKLPYTEFFPTINNTFCNT